MCDTRFPCNARTPHGSTARHATADAAFAIRICVQVFSNIDPVPLASASVAQVHTATLRSSGQKVVLKVLKPGVEAVLRTDLNFLYVATQLLQALNPELERTSVAGIVEDIRASMLDEVCLRLLATNTVRDTLGVVVYTCNLC